ncbi:MAG: FAD-dependent oxidoreductase [Prevotellaceae bacterium]|nr:FAD-dependent oxidoreductase [Prevotellaceae bacterium]
MTEIQLILSPEQAADADFIKQKSATVLNVPANDISHVQIIKKSIDARGRYPLVLLKVGVFVGEIPQYKYENLFQYNNVSGKEQVVIVGGGPAGLFAALRLIERGFCPLILERGKDIHERKKDIAQLNRNQALNEDSNYCFGEGGAGAFSDGKLFSRSKKRGNMQRILEIFHCHGAQDEILYETHPHIGTDKLPQVVENIRKTITDCGGQVIFNAKVVDLLLNNAKIEGVKTADGQIFKAKSVILATGHSARDIYELLDNKGITLQEKGFAVGVRVEHPQELIDEIQYSHHKNRFLPAASYNLVNQVDERGVYSFCMCPGGIIVPSATHQKQIVVNGMSSSKRNSPFANSGIVVEIQHEDLADYQRFGTLAGLHFQQYLENLAFVNNGGKFQTAPAQRLTDFVRNKLSTDLPECSYLPQIISSPLHFWLPKMVGKRLQRSFQLFDKRMKGFVTNEAVMLGVETRTSSPIRIIRDNETLQHPQIQGLYPCGEGAGYSGGITSSAIDGERAAEMI